MEMQGITHTTEENPLLSDVPEMALPEGHKAPENSGATFAMPRIEGGSTERADDESSVPETSASSVRSTVVPVVKNIPVTLLDGDGPADSSKTWRASFEVAKAA